MVRESFVTKKGIIVLPEQKCIPWLILFSIAYLLLPFVLFLLAWLKVWISVPYCLVLMWLFWDFSQKLNKSSSNKDRLGIKILIALAIVSLLWCLLSGVGGVFFQRFDYLKHNAIFSDLIINEWPVYFPTSAYTDEPVWLNYYFAWYLPPALMAKLVGISSIEIFSLIWTWLGAWLVLVWVVQIVKIRWAIAVATFLLFGGAELLVIAIQVGTNLIESGIDKSYLYHVARTGWEVAYADKVFRYMAHTVLLTWSPQFAIGVWLATILAWHFIISKRFLYMLWLIGPVLLLWSPMATIGLALLCVVLFEKTHWVAVWKKSYVIGGLLLVVLMLLYYEAHLPVGHFSFTFHEIDFVTFVWKYPLFLLLEYAFITLLVIPYYAKKERLIIIKISVLLAVFPFIKLGFNNDLLIQTAVAPLGLLSIFLAIFFTNVNLFRLKGWRKFALMIVIACIVANPLRYWLISLARPVLEPSLSTSTPVSASSGLNEAEFYGEIGRQYLGSSNSVFYRYLVGD